MEIQVIEEAIATISGLPQEGHKWFTRKVALTEFPGMFLEEGENVV